MCNQFKSRVWGILCVAWSAMALASNATAGPIKTVTLRGIEAPSLTEQVYYRRPRYYYVYPRYTYPNYGYAYPSYAYPSYAYPSYAYPDYAYPSYADPSYGRQNYDPTYWQRYPWRYGP